MAFELFLRRGLMAILWVSSLALLQGCIATRGWVGEQMNPVNDRLAKLEGQLGQVDSRLPTIENRLSATESRTAQAEAKADQSGRRVADLRLEKRMEMDLKDGVLYRVNSAALTDAGKKNIDSFLSDLKGGVNGGQIFVVGGHADSTGARRYNYQLARARAESVAQYLILEKKIDPMQVVTVSFGESSPMADNQTRDGREKNRRVEIRVFTEIITTGPSMNTAQR